MSTLVEVKNLKKHFPISKRIFSKKTSVVKAVDGLTFTIEKGETLGLVGESGCGKSTTGRMIMRLIEPTEGQVFFNGQDITSFSEDKLRKFRKEFQMIFQDPFASLNPRMKIGDIIEEPLIVHGVEKEERKQRVERLLDVVGLTPFHADRFPHEFSGGQRQRIGIARALAVNPQLIVADEPVSALDVSIQSQILNLLKDLQNEFGLTYLFISHDLSVVEHISDRVGVMYLGRMVELADKDSLYKEPLHPYTQALLSSAPTTNIHIRREKITLKGDLPSPSNPPSGCAFRTRCPHAFEKCDIERPELSTMTTNHFVACHLYSEK